jgi:hypothetical protein
MKNHLAEKQHDATQMNLENIVKEARHERPHMA